MNQTATVKLRSLRPDEIWSVLDLERPDLSQVRDALMAGQPEQALSALRDHFRRRFPWPAVAPDIAPQTLQEADAVTQRIFQFLGYEPVQYIEPIDWEWDPRDDIEWVACMYRFRWAEPLAKAFAATRDERYAQTFVELASDWIARHPLEEHERTHRTLTHWKGFAWLDIQTGIRASMLCQVFPILIHAESFTPQFLGVLLASFYDHQVKSELIPMGILHNKAIMEVRGLMDVAALFPEFRDARRWLELGLTRFRDNFLGQTTSDGVQREWSFGYHCHVLQDALSIRTLVEEAGIPFPHDCSERAHAMCEFLFGFATPELGMPMFGDTPRELPNEADRCSRRLYPLLQQGAEIFGEHKYLALADLNVEQLPQQASFAWPEAGLYVMRDGWGPEQIYFALHDSPPAISSHDQEDNGTFELYAYGRWLMTDTGYYTYGHDRIARVWHRQTAVHQTLTLDGANSQTQATHRLFRSETGFDAVCVDNAAYEGLLHRRTVWFVGHRLFVLLDEAIGEAKGMLDLHFQFAPGQIVLDVERKRAHTCFPDSNVLVWTDLDAPVAVAEEPGWFAWGYNKRVPRLGFRYRHARQAAPAYFLTLLVPYRGSKTPQAHAELAEGFVVGAGRAEIRAELDNNRWRLGYDLGAGRIWCEPV